MGKDGAEGDLPGRGVGGFRNAELRPGGRDGRRLAHLICGCLGVLGQSCGEVSLALVSHWGFDPFYKGDCRHRPVETLGFYVLCDDPAFLR